MTVIRIFLALLSLAVLAPATAVSAVAQGCRPWCVVYSGRGGGGTNCGFTSFEQCKMTAQGADVCTPNPACPPGGSRQDNSGSNRRR